MELKKKLGAAAVALSVVTGTALATAPAASAATHQYISPFYSTKAKCDAAERAAQKKYDKRIRAGYSCTPHRSGSRFGIKVVWGFGFYYE